MTAYNLSKPFLAVLAVGLASWIVFILEVFIALFAYVYAWIAWFIPKLSIAFLLVKILLKS